MKLICKAERYVSPEAGDITPTIVNIMKDQITEEMAEDMLELLDTLELIKWHVDPESRRITGEVKLNASKD